MSDIQRVKDATDIVAVIGERVSLQRAGTYHKGLCPFHGEKSSSFFVSESLQRYKCFGCGESGDVLTFLEKYEGLTFGEALKQLAEQAGIELTNTFTPPQDAERDKVMEVLHLADEYYHYLLTQHKVGEKGMTYLKDRGVTAESIKVFHMGYSPASWDGLLTYLHHKKKYPLEILEKAGLIIAGKGGRYYDRFRDRVMFPLRTHRGQVVGFSGRVLDPTIKEAKYINSPETEVYHKGQMLFGYSELFKEIRKHKQVILVEGELDVISSSQAHVNNVVALKGSALTQHQAKLLSRVAETVVLSLDTDSAGVEATKRAIAILKPFQIDVRVLVIPTGKDPDEMARHQPDKWREATKHTISVYDFLISVALTGVDTTRPEGKRQVLKAVAADIMAIEHQVEQEFYISKLAKELGVKVETIKNDLLVETKRQAVKGGAKRSTAVPAMTNEKTPLNADGNVLIADKENWTPRQRLEYYWLFLVLHSQQAPQWFAEFKPDYFSVIPLQALAVVVAAHAHELPNSIQNLKQYLSPDQQGVLFDIYLDPESLPKLEKLDLEEELQTVTNRLKKEATTELVKTLTKQLDELDNVPELTPEQEQRQRELLQQIVGLKRSAP
jgi:DNA primase